MRVGTVGASHEVRVLAIMDGSTVTGPLRQLAGVVAPLQRRGIALRVVAFRRLGMSAAAHLDFLAGCGIEPAVLADRGPFDPAPVRQFRRLVQDWKPDIVQTHGYRPTTIAWLGGRGGRSWRWAGWFHGATSENAKVRLYHAVDRLLLPSADQVVVVAEPQAALFPRARGKVTVIHNASLEPPQGAHEGTDLPRAVLAHLRAPRIGFVGRLSPEKGADILLRAVALLRSQDLDVALVVAGDGPERVGLERLRDDLGLGASVTFLGMIRDVRGLYDALDVVVLPSRSEGLPNTLLEALRADRPVVATAVGAVPHVLADPDSGTVVPPADVPALADGIRRAIMSGETSAAKAARARTVERFGVDERVRRHLELYEALLRR